MWACIKDASPRWAISVGRKRAICPRLHRAVHLAGLGGYPRPRRLDGAGLCRRPEPAHPGLHPHRGGQLRHAPPRPCTGRATEMLRQGKLRSYGDRAHQAMPDRHPSRHWSMADYLDAVESEPARRQLCAVGGHNQLRQCVMGDERRAAARPRWQADAAPAAARPRRGRLGHVSGLVFIPGCWSETEEVIALARIVARLRRALHLAHPRRAGDEHRGRARVHRDRRACAACARRCRTCRASTRCSATMCMKMELLEQARARGVDIIVR